MKRLNREYRGINQTTDVLSFPAEPEKGAFQHLGDLVISLPVADKMAKKLNVSRRRGIETLVIHGFLHLCGYDHEQDKGEMMALQTELERTLLEEEPLQMVAKRGRKPGSKIKVTKEGKRVVVTGRAAKAIARKENVKKVKPEKVAKPAKVKAVKPVKAKAVKPAKVKVVKAKAVKPAKPIKETKKAAVKKAAKLGRVGRPRKADTANTPVKAKRAVKRPRKSQPRSGVIA